MAFEVKQKPLDILFLCKTKSISKLILMKPPSPLQVTGLLFILSGLFTGICFELLRQHFMYPDILRMPTSYILRMYHQGGTSLQLMWYGMSMGSVLFILACLLLYDSLAFFQRRYLYLIAGLGMLAGLFNTLGFIRWVFVIPALATSYVDPLASITTKESITLIFEALHRYMGFSLGEHLGFMFLGSWGIGLSLFLYTSTHFPKWFIYIGIAASLGTFMGILEGAGWKYAAQVVSISSYILILWIVLFGFFLCSVPAPKLAHGGFYRKVGENSFERVS
jgi:hypothetical protein